MINLLFFSLVASAAPSGSLLLEPAPAKVLKNQAVTFQPKPGHHFNLKAPQSCGAKSAQDLTKESLVCQFTDSGKQNVSLKICDEKETFCKNENFVVEVPGPSTSVPAASQAPTRPLLEGFTADTEKAMAEAKASKKILFLDFGASWCPPCNSMEDTVTSTAKFRDETKGFVRVYQDVDLSTSYPWMAKFEILSFPTYVVVDENMNEIDRFVGTATPAVFAKWLHSQEALRERPLNKIELKAASPEDRLRLAQNQISREKFAAALTTLQGVNTPKAERLTMAAKIELAKGNDERLKTLLPEAIAKFDDCPEVIGWVGQWLPLAPDKSKVLATIPKIIEKLKSSNTVRDEGYTDADLNMNFAEAIEPTDAEASKKYASAAADDFEKLIKMSKEKNPRGFNMERITCLYHGGRSKEALALANKLNKVYGKDYVFNRTLARMYLKEKKYSLALKQVIQAQAKTYGDNWFELAAIKGEVLIAMGKKAEARKSVGEALAKLELPNDPHSRTQRMAKRLEDVLKQSEN